MGDREAFKGSVSLLLHSRAVTDRTRARYARAVSDFDTWLGRFEKVLRESDPRMSLDEAMTRYFTYLFNKGDPQYKATYCLHGMRLFQPGVGAGFPMALKALKGWKKIQPSGSRPVMPREVVVMMAMMMRWRFRDNDVAVLTLLAFDCYLRCGELVALRTQDLVEMRGRLYVKIPSSKTGPDQGVMVSDPDIALLAQCLVRRREPGDRLFPSGLAHQYRVVFYRALDALGLRRLGFTPHSMRHGGATHDFHHRGISVENVLLKGRWKSTTSARHYIRSLPGLLAKVPIPPQVLHYGRRCEQHLAEVFAYPG